MKDGVVMRNVLAIMAGFTAGTATALLLAPRSGRQTRRKIVRNVEDAQEYFAEVGEELVQRGEELIEEGRKRTTQRAAAAAKS